MLADLPRMLNVVRGQDLKREFITELIYPAVQANAPRAPTPWRMRPASLRAAPSAIAESPVRSG